MINVNFFKPEIGKTQVIDIVPFVNNNDYEYVVHYNTPDKTRKCLYNIKINEEIFVYDIQLYYSEYVFQRLAFSEESLITLYPNEYAGFEKIYSIFKKENCTECNKNFYNLDIGKDDGNEYDSCDACRQICKSKSDLARYFFPILFMDPEDGCSIEFEQDKLFENKNFGRPKNIRFIKRGAQVSDEDIEKAYNLFDVLKKMS
jgi:hypothetical protein